MQTQGAPVASRQPGRISLPLVVDVALKVVVVALALYPLLDPTSSHFQGKAMGVRALVYPFATLLVPAVWLLRGRPSPYPFAADLAISLPFGIDSAGNVFGLFAITGFDALPHALGWIFLSLTFGLAVVPMVERRPIAFLLVMGFGAIIDIAWEIGEYILMMTGSSGLQLTYANTVQDLATSLLGAVVAALVVATIAWPRPGTPRTLFGWGPRAPRS